MNSTKVSLISLSKKLNTSFRFETLKGLSQLSGSSVFVKQSLANLEVNFWINKQSITNIDCPSQPSQCVFRFHQNLK